MTETSAQVPEQVVTRVDVLLDCYLIAVNGLDLNAVVLDHVCVRGQVLE